MNESEGVELMKGSKTKDEWNANCDKVKKASGGQYPSWWYQKIILSGLMASLGFDSQIHVS